MVTKEQKLRYITQNLPSMTDSHQKLSVESKSGSISHLLFGENGLYLGDEDKLDKGFLALYIRGKKELFETAEVNFVKVPHYKELTVRKVYEMVKD